jgi:hypothetical protein
MPKRRILVERPPPCPGTKPCPNPTRTDRPTSNPRSCGGCEATSTATRPGSAGRFDDLVGDAHAEEALTELLVAGGPLTQSLLGATRAAGGAEGE